jgi:hypothetical protein
MLPHLRQQIAEEAIERHKATHTLWLDSDHSFPDLTAHRLLQHKRPIVGINASTRAAPILPTARKRLGEFCVTTPESTGLERVWTIGFGLILIESRVFLAMPKPWFMIECRPDLSWLGEDAYFCHKAKEAGFVPFVDHDLTKETFHFGQVGFHSRDVDQSGVVKQPDADEAGIVAA